MNRLRADARADDVAAAVDRDVYAIFAKTRAFDRLAIHPPLAGYVDGRHPRRVLETEKETAQ